MATTKKDDLITWLRDAHAMEVAHVDNIERLVGVTDDYPQLKAQLQRHLDVTRRQREEIQRQLENMGSDTSTLKDWVMRIPGRLEPLLSLFTPDSMPKNCLAAHGYEAFEIASYRSMLGAAEELGMTDLRAMCERFIREEQEMATFLFDNLPGITRQYLRGLEQG